MLVAMRKTSVLGMAGLGTLWDVFSTYSMVGRLENRQYTELCSLQPRCRCSVRVTSNTRHVSSANSSNMYKSKTPNAETALHKSSSDFK
ncbi:uncharacterized protein LAESUDRAFT_383766 [Laetiporus sulphureus 93-53]|uniref:Uncharacterized protein n=1 Tax=Laetiporus sulphureus 93-53 TaxID=1314785 RepID=A0A165CMG2_9APHY|nr:uncharacterized protein LAESUDRAFT_383766 [Laetiporus sulphureus 93-53]KZT03076.1 hypothetical protein LAESUDRAFT_383766 [Laetiporus sulphureus 93-53]